jgi:hypothetical protein
LTETFWRDRQLKKQKLPIEVDEPGTVMVISDEHPKKQHLFIEITDFGIIMVLNDEHP